jgi:hypothetical protein
VRVCTLSKSWKASPSSAAVSMTPCIIVRISSSLRPYFCASVVSVRSWPCCGALGSSSKER